MALQAGYQTGNYGVIFNGTIMQVRTGKLANVTRFVDIMAMDGDLWHCYGFVNTTINDNASDQAVQQIMTQSATDNGLTIDHNANLGSQQGVYFLRGKVLMGMAAAYLNDLGDKTNTIGVIEDGTA